MSICPFSSHTCSSTLCALYNSVVNGCVFQSLPAIRISLQDINTKLSDSQGRLPIYSRPSRRSVTVQPADENGTIEYGDMPT